MPELDFSLYDQIFENVAETLERDFVFRHYRIQIREDLVRRLFAEDSSKFSEQAQRQYRSDGAKGLNQATVAGIPKNFRLEVLEGGNLIPFPPGFMIEEDSEDLDS